MPCGIGPNNTSTRQVPVRLRQRPVAGRASRAAGHRLHLLGLQPLESGQPLHQPVQRLAGLVSGWPSRSRPIRASLTRGVAAQATISKDNHTITLNAHDVRARTRTSRRSSPRGTSTFVFPSTNARVGDDVRAARLDQDQQPRHASVRRFRSPQRPAPARSLLAGFSGTWRPNDNDNIALSFSLGSSQPSPTDAAQLQRSAVGARELRRRLARRSADRATPRRRNRRSTIRSRGRISGSTATSAPTCSGNRKRASSSTRRSPRRPATCRRSSSKRCSSISPPCVRCRCRPAIYVNQAVNGTNRLYQGYDISAPHRAR